MGVAMSNLKLAIVVVVTVLLSTATSATAARLITGKQIKDNTVTTADVKDNSLKSRDFARAERKKLRGPRGLTGPAGTAIAYGSLTENASGAPIFYTRSPNVTGVRRPAGWPAGYYCLSFRSGTPRARIDSAVASSTASGVEVTLHTSVGSSSCSASELGVFTFLRSTGAATDAEFTFVVP